MKRNTVAVLVAALMAMAVAVPMAMAQIGEVVVEIDNLPPQIEQKWEVALNPYGEVPTPELVGLKGLMDICDIGDPISESTHGVTEGDPEWGPIEPTANPGHWGGCGETPTQPNCDGDTTLRVTHAPSIGDTDPGASVTLQNDGTGDKLLIRVLDGIANDDFEVYVSYPGGGEQLVYTYISNPSTNEYWVTHAIENIPAQNAALTVRIVATGPSWWGLESYGQLGVSWIALLYKEYQYPEDAYLSRVWPTPNGDTIVNKYVIVSDPNGKEDIASVEVWVVPGKHTYDDLDPANSDTYLEYEELERVSMDAAQAILLEQSELGILDDWDEWWKKRLIHGGEELWTGRFLMNYQDLFGYYTVCVKATDSTGNVDWLDNTFYYETITVFEIDFDTIVFPSTAPGQTGWSTPPGDTVWDVPIGPNPPTIHNAGNDPMNVEILASDFSGTAGTITGDNFDAKVDDVGPMSIKPLAIFNVEILASELVPVDFSVHVPPGTQPGSYTGTITLTGVHA